MNKEDKRLTINDLTIDDYLKDFKRAIDEDEWYEIEGKFLKPLYEQIINLQQENKQLKERIQDALGIVNERINYYFHINNEEVLKDLEDIFDVLKGDSNENK